LVRRFAKWLAIDGLSKEIAMKVELFHADNLEFFNVCRLRRRASQVVRESSLVGRAWRGDRVAAVALKTGFWPFVREFEVAIDRQFLPRQALIEKFGDRRARRVFIGMTRAVRDMKQEEGSHAAHWVKDARCLGISEIAGPCVPGVRALIERSYTKDLPAFFATLAGTEFIAEELSRFLVGSKRFTDLFSRKRWIWGEVHLATDEDGPSHLDIDLDLARAYGTAADAVAIEEMVLDTIALFSRAADDVEGVLLPELAAA
jgi:hypothetical protein